jgi:two-component sensor histidine kinase
LRDWFGRWFRRVGKFAEASGERGVATDKALKKQNAHLLELLERAGVDTAQRDVAARAQAILTDELHHRMRNMIAMVTAIVRQSMRSATNLAQAETAIGTRLIAMAKAHDQLLKSNWQSAALTTVIEDAIDQHNGLSGRIIIQGEEIEVASSSIIPLSLLINELCTNATKYGALSKDGGLVRLSWIEDAAQQSLIVRWVESGGPPVTKAATASFGMRLIESGIPRQLGGTGHLNFLPSGVEFELIIPLDRLRPLEPD